MADELAAVVMAGGLGTRMKSATPKHLYTLLGRRMVDWVIGAAREAGAGRVVVVTSPDTRDLYDGVEVAVQERPLGTGDAVRAARAALEGAAGDVLVLNGDVPALTPATLQALVAAHRDA
ncbi:MAG TPA: NTP transferase domain-containing protein, partial [Gaiellaceae bacterium]|nr:NTP transferase domain-containing protein [Gaiellaceae bacterium]